VTISSAWSKKSSAWISRGSRWAGKREYFEGEEKEVAMNRREGGKGERIQTTRSITVLKPLWRNTNSRKSTRKLATTLTLVGAEEGSVKSQKKLQD